MSEVRHDEGLLRLEARAVGAGAVAGVLAGIAMGVVFELGTDVMPVLGAFAGESSALRGWLVHLVLSMLYGVAFAFIVAYPPVADFAASFGLTEWILVGVTYTVMVGAVTLGILPFVAELPWAASDGGTPFVLGEAPGVAGILPGVAFAIGHLLFGVILGAVYATIGE